jgi:flavin-dependent dehydrogenase
MRIAIAGAGLAGSYIWRLLKMGRVHQVDIYDRPHAIACGIHPCGYGVDERFNPLAELAGLSAASYICHDTPRHFAEVAGISAQTTVFMIDKPRLIADLLNGTRVHYDPIDITAYDIVVDATGEARAYASPLANDLKARVVQWRVRVAEPSGLVFLPTIGIPGYAWVMPLNRGGTELHVGAGCRTGLDVPSRALTGPAFRSLQVQDTLCACGGRIRLSGPDFRNVVSGNVWAVGEAAGLVGPASGAGNVYAMESGLELVRHLGDAPAYVEGLRRHFSFLVPEARAVRRVLLGRLPAPADAYHIRQGWIRAGVKVAWRDLPRLMIAMKRAFAGVEPKGSRPMEQPMRSSTI